MQEKHANFEGLFSEFVSIGNVYRQQLRDLGVDFHDAVPENHPRHAAIVAARDIRDAAVVWAYAKYTHTLKPDSRLDALARLAEQIGVRSPSSHSAGSGP